MIVIKKYANRRLYDTTASAYVNLEQIADRIRDGHRIQVVDAKGGQDLTQQVLLQVVLEVQGGEGLLPSGLLHRVIRSTTEHPMQQIMMKQLGVGLQLLDQQMDAFERQAGWTRTDPPPPTEPSTAAQSEESSQPKAPRPSKDRGPSPPVDAELDALRSQLENLERRLSEQSRGEE